MHKAVRGKKLTSIQKQKNKVIQKSCYVVEQSFGILKRILKFDRRYFGLDKVHGQGILKSICLNLLKACNKIMKYRIVTPKMQKLVEIR